MPRGGGRSGGGRSWSPRQASPTLVRSAPPSRAAAPPSRAVAPPPRPAREVHHHHYGTPPKGAPTKAPAAQAPSPPAAAPAPGAKAPGLMAQMAATAGGVAIGSTVGHVVGHALTSGGSGSANHGDGGAAPAASASPQPAAVYQPPPTGLHDFSPSTNSFTGGNTPHPSVIDDGSLAAGVQKGPCASMLQDLLDCVLRSTTFEGCEAQMLGLRECASQNQIEM